MLCSIACVHELGQKADSGGRKIFFWVKMILMDFKWRTKSKMY